MATKYLTFEGDTFKSGDKPRLKAITGYFSGSVEFGFSLSSNSITLDQVYRAKDSTIIRVDRTVFKGTFQYSSDGRLLSGAITDIAIGLKKNALETPRGNQSEQEIIFSFKPNSKSISYSNSILFSGPPAMDFTDIGEYIQSVSFFYTYPYSDSARISGKYFQDVDSSKDISVVDKTLFPDGWWNNPFATSAASPQSPLTGTAKKADIFALTGTPEFGAGTADRITNFNPKEKDKLQIDVSNFGSNAAGTFKVAKNSKALNKALASTTDFIYLKSTGELYYNENGNLPGFGDGGVFAILENKANITTKNVEFL